MLLLIDENVPDSVARLFVERGHDVRYVRDLFPAGTPDPVIATIGDRLAAIVVTWDRDFERLVRRIPEGNRARFRRLGRISFKCNEVRGRELLIKWIDMIEFHYERALGQSDIRMMVQISGKRCEVHVRDRSRPSIGDNSLSSDRSSGIPTESGKNAVDDQTYQIAQANIARAVAPLDDPVMAGFVEQLDYINSVADRSPGFIWRLQTPDGDATAIRAFDDDRIIFNMSVWASIEALYAYTYRSDHLGPLRDRRKWFERMDRAHLVLWWVPAGHVPTLEEAVERLDSLDRNGPSPHAFTLRHAFTPDGAPFNPKDSADWAFDGTGA